MVMVHWEVEVVTISSSFNWMHLPLAPHPSTIKVDETFHSVKFQAAQIIGVVIREGVLRMIFYCMFKYIPI